MIYAPVLRLKQSEWLALKELSDAEKDKMCPIIEPTRWFSATEDRGKLRKNIIKTTSKLYDALGGRKALFDPYIVEHYFDIENFISNFFPEAESIGLSLVPVVRLKSSPEYLKVIRQFIKKGHFGLRIVSDDLVGDYVGRINAMVNSFASDKSNVDLIYDYKLLEGGYPEISEIAGQLPSLVQWHSFIAIGGSFPIYPSVYREIDTHTIERKEWTLWLRASEGTLPRLPIFGDYTIQHPIYTEAPPGVTASASVRYTAGNNWLLFRGESLKKGTKYQQYVAHALALKDHSDFYGSDFSSGDRYIYDMGMKMENGEENIKTGTPGSWLKAGINHHMAVVVEQLSNQSAI